MKFALILPAVFALTAGTAVPVIPGDNSHYVEGVSRYIWMTDHRSDSGGGKPILVDLHEPIDEAAHRNATRNGANNQYLLFTRNNPLVPQILENGNPSSIQNSNYLPGRELKVIVHGWREEGSSDVNTLCTSAFLSYGDFNVIVVDWHELADENYLIAALGVSSVGQNIGSFLWWLVNTFGGNWNTVHLVGFSLGAHIVGNAGRTLGGRCARITALDPAGPLWDNNNYAINKNDGVYVEAIHTDGGVLGIFNPVADADFYPNGGINPMPGCLLNTCSHDRAYQYFASSVIFNHFAGRFCNDIDEALNRGCMGHIHNMGNGILSKRGEGLYGLSTSRFWPY